MYNNTDQEKEKKSFDSINEFKTLIETPETKPLALVDSKGIIQYSNKSFNLLFNLFEGDSINLIPSEPSLSLFIQSLVSSKYSSFHFEIFLLKNISTIPDNYFIDIERIFVDGHQLMVLVFTSGAERRQIEDRINNLHNALEYGNVTVAITDDKGIINYSSRSFDSLVNSSIQYIYNSFLPDILQPFLSTDDYLLLKNAIFRKSEWVSLVTTILDGKKYYKELKLNPVVKNYSDSVNFILTVNDISEYIEKNQIILRSAERQKLVINNISDPILIIRKEANSFIFEGANEAFYTCFNISRENLIKFEDIKEESIVNFVKELVNELDNSDSIVLSKNYTNCTNNNKYICKISHFNQTDLETTTYVITFTDLTERIKAEEQLRLAYEKEIQLNKLKSAFLANMSHEFRTPLNAIAGYSDLLEDDIKNKEYDYLFEYTTYLKEGVQRLVKLVDNILEISFLESGINDIEKEPVNINYLIRSIFNSFINKMQASNVSGNLDLDPLEPKILSDESKILKILENLIDNAIKYNKPDGKIIIQSFVKNNNVYIKIIDTGIGIDTSKLEKIIKPFEQEEDLAHTRNYEGAGLGLTISYRLTLKLNGEFLINSEVNKGTEITLIFPLFIN